MEYRKLGRTGLNVSAIGLGTEHLEKSRETMEEVLRTAVDAGVNYIDVLYSNPESDWDNFGPALRSYRDKLILAAHWIPANHPLSHDADKCQRYFEGVLAHMGNFAEVAILTAVSDLEKEWVQKAAEHLLRYKEQGRIGYIGVSDHGASTAIKAVNSGLIDVLMLPINIIGHNDEANSALYQACADQNVGIVAMKPYHGGALFFAEGKPSGITPTQCLAYVLSLPISTTVPGAKNLQELRATLHYLEATDEEKDYSSVVADIHGYLAGQCVYCHHCLPCPQNIEIGWVIWYVDQTRGGITDEWIRHYSALPVKASECTECGVCMERCPFEVDVIAKMREAVEIFETKAG
jgi:predicted aldo/keto reductase-like oxidoreductase